jgi:hypothetical protein
MVGSCLFVVKVLKEKCLAKSQALFYPLFEVLKQIRDAMFSGRLR